MLLLLILTCDSNLNVKWSLAHRVFGFDSVDGWIWPLWWGNDKLRHSLCIDNINPRGYWLIIPQPSDLWWRFSLEISTSDKWDKVVRHMQSCHTVVNSSLKNMTWLEWGYKIQNVELIYSDEEGLCMQTRFSVYSYLIANFDTNRVSCSDNYEVLWVFKTRSHWVENTQTHEMQTGNKLCVW